MSPKLRIVRREKREVHDLRESAQPKKSHKKAKGFKVIEKITAPTMDSSEKRPLDSDDKVKKRKVKSSNCGPKPKTGCRDCRTNGSHKKKGPMKIKIDFDALNFAKRVLERDDLLVGTLVNRFGPYSIFNFVRCPKIKEGQNAHISGNERMDLCVDPDVSHCLAICESDWNTMIARGEQVIFSVPKMGGEKAPHSNLWISVRDVRAAMRLRKESLETETTPCAGDSASRTSDNRTSRKLSMRAPRAGGSMLGEPGLDK